MRDSAPFTLDGPADGAPFGRGLEDGAGVEDAVRVEGQLDAAHELELGRILELGHEYGRLSLPMPCSPEMAPPHARPATMMSPISR